MRPLEVDDWEYLDRLEEEEEKEAHRTKQLKLDNDSYTANAGWKKGFLGKDSSISKKPPAQKSSIKAVAAPAMSTLTPVESSAAQLARNTAANSTRGVHDIAASFTAPPSSAPDIDVSVERPVSRFKAARSQQAKAVGLPSVPRSTSSEVGNTSSEVGNKAFTGHIKER